MPMTYIQYITQFSRKKRQCIPITQQQYLSTIQQKKDNVYQLHSNNIYQLYNTSPVSEKPFYTSNDWGIKQAQTYFSWLDLNTM